MTDLLTALDRFLLDRPAAGRLAELAALAVLVETQLLRRLRLQLLPGVTVDAEYDLWHSPLVQSSTRRGLVFHAEVRRALRNRLSADRARLEAAWQITQTQHRAAPQTIRWEEELHYLALRGELSDSPRLTKILQQAIAQALREDPRDPSLARWAARALPELPPEVLHNGYFARLALAAQTRFGEPSPLTRAVTAEALQDAAWMVPSHQGYRRLYVRRVGWDFEFTEKPRQGAHPIDVPDLDPALLSVEVRSLPTATNRSESSNPSNDPPSADLATGDALLVVNEAQLSEANDLAQRFAQQFNQQLTVATVETLRAEINRRRKHQPATIAQRHRLWLWAALRPGTLSEPEALAVREWTRTNGVSLAPTPIERRYRLPAAWSGMPWIDLTRRDDRPSQEALANWIRAQQSLTARVTSVAVPRGGRVQFESPSSTVTLRTLQRDEYRFEPVRVDRQRATTTTWYRGGTSDSKRLAVVVFLHGDRDEPQLTWGDLPQMLAAGEQQADWDVVALGVDAPLMPDAQGNWPVALDLAGLGGAVRDELQAGTLASYRLVTLVSHSLGGLVVQRVLATDTTFDKRLSRVIQFGTPNQPLTPPWWQRQILRAEWEVSKSFGPSSAVESTSTTDGSVAPVGFAGNELERLRTQWAARMQNGVSFLFRPVIFRDDELVPPHSALHREMRESSPVVLDGDHFALARSNRNRPFGEQPAVSEALRLITGESSDAPPLDPRQFDLECAEIALRNFDLPIRRLSERSTELPASVLSDLALALDSVGRRDEALAVLGTDALKPIQLSLAALGQRRLRRWQTEGTTDDADHAVKLLMTALEPAPTGLRAVLLPYATDLLAIGWTNPELPIASWVAEKILSWLDAESDVARRAIAEAGARIVSGDYSRAVVAMQIAWRKKGEIEAYDPDRLRLLALAGATPDLEGRREIEQACAGRLAVQRAAELRTVRAHTDLVNQVLTSPDEQHVVTCANDGDVVVWDRRGELRHRLSGHRSAVWQVAISADSRLLASGSLDGTVRIWNLSDGRLLHELDEEWGEVTQVGFAAGDRYLVTKVRDKRWSKKRATSISIWNWSTGQRVAEISGERWGGFDTWAVSPDGQVLVAAPVDGSQLLSYLLPLGVESEPFAGGEVKVVTRIEFARQGRWFVTNSETEPRLKLWDLSSRRMLGVFEGHVAPVTSLALADEGRVLFSASHAGEVIQWDVERREAVHQFRGHVGSVSDLRATPDGQWLVTAGKDHWLRVWMAGEWSPYAEFRSHSPLRSCGLADTGRTVVGGDEQGFVDWAAYRDDPRGAAD